MSACNIIRVIAATTLIASSCALADYDYITDGAALLQNCAAAERALVHGYDGLTPADRVRADICISWLGGFAAATQVVAEYAKLELAIASNGQYPAGEFRIHCLPKELRHMDMVRSVMDYLRAHPDELGRKPRDLVMRALKSGMCP